MVTNIEFVFGDGADNQPKARICSPDETIFDLAVDNDGNLGTTGKIYKRTLELGFTKEKTGAGTYTQIGASIYFAGSNNTGTPSSIKVIGYVDGGATASLRFYDVTNSLQICEAAGITISSEGIIDLGTISNVPTGEAVWQIQGKITSGTGNVWVGNITLVF